MNRLEDRLDAALCHLLDFISAAMVVGVVIVGAVAVFG